MLERGGLHGNKVWTLEKLKKGFLKFQEDFGHFPTAIEIDECPYLPSSRQIQRYEGGLVSLRQVLGLEITNFTKGTHRGDLARKYTVEALRSESEVRQFLDNRFGEICVHEQKKYGNSRNTVDFLVYASENFGVEVFNTGNYRTLASNLNIKLKKYVDFPHKLYFIAMGDFEQQRIDGIVENKISRLANRMRCVTFETFTAICDGYTPLSMSTPYNRA